MSLLIPKKALLLATPPGVAAINPNDVFQSRLRTGNVAARSEAVGWQPSLVWIKRRDSTGSHYLFDTDRGAPQEVNTDTTDASASLSGSLTSFDASGYSLGALSATNGSGSTFVDWLFKETPGFFKKGQFTKASGVAQTIDLSSLGQVGAVIVKATSTTSNWSFWHRGLTPGNNLVLNATTAQSTTNAYISVSGTTMTFDASAPAATYEYYAFAHQPAGIIQCGSYDTINGTVTVNLGWDAQWLFITGSTAGGPRAIYDTARGLTASAAQALVANTTGAESASVSIRATTNGFTDSQTSAATRVYIAIKKGAA